MELVRKALANHRNHRNHRNLHPEPLMKGKTMKKIDNPNYDRQKLADAIEQLRAQERALAREGA